MLNKMKSKIIDLKLTPQERSFVIPITMSGMFQWFEFFLFIYWSKIFEPEAQFADFFGPLTELGYVILLFIIHLFSRPIGGIIFGFIGDKFGRRIAFAISITLTLLPSTILTFSSSFPAWSHTSIIYWCLIRLSQGIPAGGELPGALCMLYEGSNENNKRRKYLCSYLFVGSQLGQFLSVLTIFSLQYYLTHEELITDIEQFQKTFF